MRIAIDARLNAYRQGGISQYTRQLMTALADVAADEQIISLQHRDQLRPLAIAPSVTRRTALTPPHHRFEQWTLPLEVLLARPDVLHCPDFIAPLRRPCPAVVTIHDLAFMHYPDILDTQARIFYSQVTSNAPRADAIIAVSEATRQDIAQFLDIPIEQIDVIYEAAAPLYTRIDMRMGEARVLNSTPVAADTFMLFVSTLEPRKNLPTLLQALRICLDRKPDADYRLVIVGRRGWRDEAIFQTVRDLKLADHVLFAGGVGQYDLRWLYNACRLYINPSLYEGFGLPLLEAMACGAACLAAATSSLPEIGGSAALYVPPLDAAQWADEIMALWDDEERRAELGRLGLARAQQFSWLRAARETMQVYRRAAQRIVPRSESVPAHRPPVADLFDEQPQAQQPAMLFTGIPAGEGQPRPCLRCGTALVEGELLQSVAIPAQAPKTDEQLRLILDTRAWTCPRCGYVEIVAERPQAAHSDPLALDEQLAPAAAEEQEAVPMETQLAAVGEELAETLEVSTSEAEPEAAAVEEPAEVLEVSAGEAEPEAAAVEEPAEALEVSAGEAADETLPIDAAFPAEEPAQEPLLVGSQAELLAHPEAADAQAAGDEAPSQAGAEAAELDADADAEPPVALADAPIEAETLADAPIEAHVGGIEEETLADAPIEAHVGGADAWTATPDPLASPPEQDAQLLVPVLSPPAHASEHTSSPASASLNGTASLRKHKSSRGQRRDKPAADPAASTGKPRQPRSKRKPTT